MKISGIWYMWSSVLMNANTKKTNKQNILHCWQITSLFNDHIKVALIDFIHNDEELHSFICFIAFMLGWEHFIGFD